jgi:hypothetical protein
MNPRGSRNLLEFGGITPIINCGHFNDCTATSGFERLEFLNGCVEIIHHQVLIGYVPWWVGQQVIVPKYQAQP